MPKPMVPIGDTCTTDKQCGDGRCLKPTDNVDIFGGGPAGGYCTLDCATDEDCPGLLDLCAKAQGAAMGICLQGCTHGVPDFMFLNDPLDPDKCFGRDDSRCADLQLGPLCIPTCGSDSECAGRSCDPLSGVCVDTPNPGLPVGAKCDPMKMPSECAGTCLPIVGGASMCTSPCTMGGDIPSNECGGLDKGLCLWSPQGTGLGDAGFCGQSCKQHDECQNPAFWCTDIGLMDPGFCTTQDPCTVQADCKGMMEVCTQTKYGGICLRGNYPLGNAAPGAGGAGGGGGAGSSSSSSSSSGAGGAGGAGGAVGVGGAGGN